MRSEKLRKLASDLRKHSADLEDRKREKCASIAVVAVGLEVLRKKILSEIP